MRPIVTRAAVLISSALILCALAPAGTQGKDARYAIAGVSCDKKGTVYTPTVIVKNTWPGTYTCEVSVSIGDSEFSILTGDLYMKRVEVEIPGNDVRTVTFPSFDNGVEYTTLYYYFSVEPPGMDIYDDDVRGSWSW
jgi:hypothetical protein